MNTCSHDTPSNFSKLFLPTVFRNNLEVVMLFTARKTHAYKNECY